MSTNKNRPLVDDWKPRAIPSGHGKLNEEDRVPLSIFEQSTMDVITCANVLDRFPENWRWATWAMLMGSGEIWSSGIVYYNDILNEDKAWTERVAKMVEDSFLYSYCQFIVLVTCDIYDGDRHVFLVCRDFVTLKILTGQS